MQRRLGSRALLFVVVLFIFWLFKRPELLVSSLDVDELITSNWIRLSWFKLVQILHYDTHFPFYFLLLKAATFLPTPENDYWLRIPSLLISSVALFMGIQHWLNRGTDRENEKKIGALYFALLFLFLPLLTTLSIYGRPYCLLILGTVWLLLLTQQSLEQGEPLLSRSFVSATAVLLMAHPLGVVFWFSIFCSNWIFQRSQIWRVHSKAVPVLLGLTVILVFGLIVHKQSPLDKIQWANLKESYNLTTCLLAIMPVTAWIFLPVLLILTRRKLSRFAGVLTICFVLQLGVFLIFSEVSSLMIPRYWVSFAVLIVFLFVEIFFAIQSIELRIGAVLLCLSQFVASPPPRALGPKESFANLKLRHQVLPNESWICVGATPQSPFLPIVYMRGSWGRNLCSQELGIEEFLTRPRTPNKNLIFFDKQQVSDPSLFAAEVRSSRTVIYEDNFLLLAE